MKVSVPKMLAIAAIVFAVIFCFNYFGNTEQDRMSRALMVGAGGAAGYLIYQIFVNRSAGKEDGDRFNFD